jgi:CheY-like chemotaxis protein
MAPRTSSVSNSRQLPAVLVVEDDALLRLGTAEFLRAAGFEVLEAASADDALAILETDAGVALVFSDVQMPGAIDGADLARWIGRECPGVQVVLTSGVFRAGELDGLGDVPFLAKPYDLTELERRIRTSLIR